jgi:hypothetical protein
MTPALLLPGATPGFTARAALVARAGLLERCVSHGLHCAPPYSVGHPQLISVNPSMCTDGELGA